MASTDRENERFPTWLRLTVAMAVTGTWMIFELGQLANRPPPGAVLNGAFLLVVGSICSHELARTFTRALRRVLEASKEADD